MRRDRRDRRFRPALAPLEARLPLDGDCGTDPFDCPFAPAEHSIAPADDGAGDPFAEGGPLDPFEHSFADPIDPTPDFPAPPDSAPGFPPD